MNQLKIVSFVFLLSFCFSCEEDFIASKDGDKVSIDDVKSSSNNIYEVTVNAQRIGLKDGELSEINNNGKGIDIVARPGGVFIIGKNNKVHKYDFDNDVFVEWGGTGKRISANQNHVIIRDMNNKIKSKPMSNASASWTELAGSGTCNDVAGSRNETGFGNWKVAIVGTNQRVYSHNNSSWAKQTNKEVSGDKINYNYEVAIDDYYLWARIKTSEGRSIVLKERDAGTSVKWTYYTNPETDYQPDDIDTYYGQVFYNTIGTGYIIDTYNSVLIRMKDENGNHLTVERIAALTSWDMWFITTSDKIYRASLSY